jgi:hypothetical protein
MLLIMSIIVVVGFAISIFYHYVMGVYKGLEYPYNTFLFRPANRWMDFTNNVSYSDNPYLVAKHYPVYLPFFYKIASLSLLVNQKTARSIFLIVYVLAFFYVAFRQFRLEETAQSLQNTFIISSLSYPFLFALDRANFEILVFFCLYLYIFLYRKHPSLSAFFLGLAIAMKGFPVILAILLLADRRYKEIAIAAIISLSASLLSYATYPGGLVVNVGRHLHVLDLYTKNYVIGNEGLYFGNSLFGALKFFSILADSQMMSDFSYTILVVAGSTVLAVYVIFIEKKMWKRIAVLICALNLFPQVSADYKLLHFFIPIFLFVNETEHDRMDWLYLVLFSLLLIPKDYYHLPTLPEASISVLLSPLLMLLLTISIMMSGLMQLFKSHPRRAHLESAE